MSHRIKRAMVLAAGYGKRLLPLEQAMNDLDFPLSLERSRSLRESLV